MLDAAREVNRRGLRSLPHPLRLPALRRARLVVRVPGVRMAEHGCGGDNVEG
jgi:hypothetical protein